MEISEKIIAEIADNLDIGMLCFVHKRTGNIKTIIDEMRWLGADTEAWEDDMEEIDTNRSSYIEFEAMNSHESFEVMLDFTETVRNEHLQQKLERALSRSKPFRHFKNTIDHEDDYREEWFAYKKERYIEFVKQQMREYDIKVSR